MGILLSVFLPLSLAFIMFSLGLGLTLADFARVVAQPKAFFAGAVSQLVLLPLIAFILLQFFRLEPELAVGVMILAFCPGGVTSNIMTKLAGGAVALSVTLTGIVSLVSVVTVPLLVAWSANWFMGQAAPDIDVTALALAMFAITAVPVAIGVAIRHFANTLATRIEPTVMRIATVLFIVRHRARSARSQLERLCRQPGRSRTSACGPQYRAPGGRHELRPAARP